MLLFLPIPTHAQAPPSQAPPLIRRSEASPAPRFLPLPEAVQQVMEDYDSDEPGRIREPLVAPADRPSLRWLRAAALMEDPANPFPKGSTGHHEAEQLLALFHSGFLEDASRLATLQTREPGSALALWVWGKRTEKKAPLLSKFRQAWEDKLLEPHVHPMLRGNALRHALCFALAEKDETRFGQLRSRWILDAASMLNGFQGLFGLLGGKPPEFRFWELPGLEYRDLPFDLLRGWDGKGANRIWICPMAGGMPMLPPGTAWVVPTLSAQQDQRETTLMEGERKAGEALAEKIRSAGGKAYLAPGRRELEPLGFAYFPILIELDFDGTIRSIRMGDAAPAKP